MFIDGFNSIYNNNSATSTFEDLFNDSETFLTKFRASPLNDESLKDEFIKKVYSLLYAEYGDSYFKSTNDTRNELKTFSILANEGVIYQKKLDIENEIIKLTLDDLTAGDLVISNFAENPGSEDAITSDAYNGDDFIKYINNQSVNKTRLSKLEAYKLQLYAIRNVTSEFIKKFNVLFETLLWSSYLPIYSLDDNEDDEK